MTEYDYSPEAYERHVRKQQAIAQWVDNTNLYTPANPFVPLPSEASSATFRPKDGGLNIDIERPSPSRRAYSYDTDGGHRTPHGRNDRHRSRKHSSPASPSYIYSSQPARRHSSQPRTPYGQEQQHPYYSSSPQQYSSPYASPSRTPTASPPPDSAHRSRSSQPTVMPINNGQGGYFIIPPKGVAYQAVYPQQAPPAQPWYKRVFSPPADSNSGKNNMVKTRRDSRKSSKSLWSLDIY